MSDQRIHSSLAKARRQAAVDAAKYGKIEFDISLGGVPVPPSKPNAFGPPNGTWTLETFRALCLNIMDQVAQSQIQLNNPPERMFIDGSPVKNPAEFNKSILLTFTSGDDVRDVVRKLEASVSGRIPKTTWTWKVVAADPTRRKALMVALNSGGGPVRLRFGDTLYYVPTSFTGGEPDATYGNILFKRGKQRDAKNKGKSKPGTVGKRGRTTGKGWYGLTSAPVRAFGNTRGVYVRAVHSFKYVPRGRKLPPGKSVGDRTRSGGVYQGSWAFVLRLQLGRRSR